MTSGSTPPIPVKNEAEYARKLALALLSTLETKGFLTKVDVDTILAVAHRTALQAEGHTDEDVHPGPAAPARTVESARVEQSAVPPQPSVLTAPIEVKRPLGPAVLGTRWVKPEAVAPTVRRETADLTHDSEAVKITGQSASEGQSRPLAPAIVTQGFRTLENDEQEGEILREGDEAVTIVIDESSSDDVQTLQLPEEISHGAKSLETNEHERGSSKERPPVVIDFEMD